MKEKKAVSPMVSTSILIVIVVILAIAILLWSQGFIKEAITKNIGGSEKRADEFCSEVKMNGFVNDDGTFGFENTGNVPIHSFNVKVEKESKSRIVEFQDPVSPGFSIIILSSDIGGFYSDFDSVKIIPILLGKTDSGTKPNPCNDRDGLVI
jgi:flagellin-like protein